MYELGHDAIHRLVQLAMAFGSIMGALCNVVPRLVDGQIITNLALVLGLLVHPALTDPRPTSKGGLVAAQSDGGANAAQAGDPALDTADWRDDGAGPDNLRVDYVLPSRAFVVTGTGVFWPAPDDPLFPLLGGDGNGGSRHRLVWVDLVLQR